MMAMLTKPLYLLETIDEDTVAVFAMLPFIEEDPNRPGVFLSQGTTNTQIQSRDAAWSHKPCAECNDVLTGTLVKQATRGKQQAGCEDNYSDRREKDLDMYAKHPWGNRYLNKTTRKIE